MENKKKPFYWIFYKSFTDTRSYKHFASKNFFRPFIYLLLISLLLSIALCTYYVITINPYADDLISQITASTAQFEIREGKLVYQNGKSAILAETKDKGTLVIIDTQYTGAYSKYEEYDTVVVLGSDEIYLSNSNTRYSLGYDSFITDDTVLTSDMMYGIIENVKTYLYVFLYLFIFSFIAINYLLYSLLIALIVGTIRRIRAKKTDFGISMQLTVYALSLPAILYIVWILTSVDVSFVDILFLVLALIIAYKGIGSYYDDDKKETEKVDT